MLLLLQPMWLLFKALECLWTMLPTPWGSEKSIVPVSAVVVPRQSVSRNGWVTLQEPDKASAEPELVGTLGSWQILERGVLCVVVFAPDSEKTKTSIGTGSHVECAVLQWGSALSGKENCSWTYLRHHSPTVQKHAHITENYMFSYFHFEKINLAAFLLRGLHSQEVEETAWNLFEMHEFHMGCSGSHSQSRELATCGAAIIYF